MTSIHAVCPTVSESRSKDLFISYSRRDKGWVDDYLKRLLTAAQVEYAIDEEDFPIGGLLDEIIQKTMSECRYALLVMTPDWVRGKWTHYESLLATLPAEQDSVTDGHRILPIKLRPCEVPPHIAPHVYLDLSDPKRRDEGIDKLLRQIGVGEESIARALNSVAKKTLLWLIELLDDPQVAEKVSKFRALFLQMQHNNEMLAGNKQLHDDLQDIQMIVSDPLEFHADPLDWSRFRMPMLKLRNNVYTLLSHCAAVPDDLVDVTFADSFRERLEDLEEAFRSRDTGDFLCGLEYLCSQLNLTLSKLNERIVRHVKDRRTEDLVQCLEEVCKTAADVEFDERASDLLGKFRSGIATLLELDGSIRELVDDHQTLQKADEEFQMLLAVGNLTLPVIKRRWKTIARWLSRLKLANRYETLRQQFDQLSRQLSNEADVRDERYEMTLKELFTAFVFETRCVFNLVDIDLLKLCKHLKPHGNELEQILKRMHNDDTQS